MNFGLDGHAQSTSAATADDHKVEAGDAQPPTRSTAFLIRMAEETTMTTDNLTVTETITQEEEPQVGPTLHLKLKKPKDDKKVKWSTGTIDNEHLNKRKSKCCCIYEKPKLFGESSSEEDDDETDHCRGHKGKCFRHGSKDHAHGPSDGSYSNEAGPSS